VKSEPPPSVRNSDEFAVGLFRPHGRAQMWSEGSIIYSVAEGPFNAEFVKALQLARGDLVAKTKIAAIHGHIVQVHTSMMASPDMLENYARFIEGLGETIATATAWVIAPEVEGRAFMLPLFEQLYAERKLNFKAFEKLADAQAWVHSFVD
jgi:hypothetical protein